MDGFLAQLVKHRTSNAKVVGSILVEARFFFRLTLQLLDNCFISAMILSFSRSKVMSILTINTIQVKRTEFEPAFVAVAEELGLYVETTAFLLRDDFTEVEAKGIAEKRSPFVVLTSITTGIL